MRPKVHAESVGALEERLGALFEEIGSDVLPAFERRQEVSRTDRGLARARRAHKKRARSAIQTASEQ